MIGGACFLLAAALQWCGGVGVLGSDVNWGKRVSCFVVDGSVVCPGCNYRAGLTCPRKLKDSQNCLVSSTTPPSTTAEPTEKMAHEVVNSTDPTFFVSVDDPTTRDANEIQKEPTKSPFNMTLFLYRQLGPKLPVNRYKREIRQEEEKEEPEICNWNGDCPCPLICCKTGPGCPKRCVMGIRLPPPWG